MSNHFDLREELYEDYLTEYGDGDCAADLANDAAIEIQQAMLEAEEQQRDLLDLDNDIRFEDLLHSSNDSDSLPLQVAAASSGSMGNVVALVAAGVVGVGMVGYWLCKKLKQGPPTGAENISPSSKEDSVVKSAKQTLMFGGLIQ